MHSDSLSRSLVTPSYLQCSEMNDTINIWVFCEYIIESFLIFDVKTDKLWPLPADEFNAVDNLF
jgi:hypothetical protein